MGRKRVDTILRRVFWSLLFFLSISISLKAKTSDKAVLYYTKAQYLSQEGKIEEAEKLYIKAYKLSNDSEILRALIKNEISSQKYKKAYKWLKEYEKKFGIDNDFLKIKAVYFYNIGEADSLRNIYDRLYDRGERGEKFLDVYLNLLFEGKKYDSSLRVLNETRKTLPTYFYYKNKAAIFNALNDYDSSLIYYDSLGTLGDSFVNYAVVGKAMVYEDEGKLKKAITLYEKLPGNFYVKDKLADLYYQTGDFHKLKGILDTLLYLNPNNARYWRYRGRIAEKNEKYQYAFAYYLASQNLDSLEYLSCYFLGNLYTVYKDFHRSEKWYKKSVERFPDFKDGYYKIILTEIQLSETDTAFKYLNEAFKRFTFKDTDYIYNLKGQLLYDKGNYDSSKKYLLRFKDDEFSSTLLASIYAHEDSVGEALKIYKRLLKSDSSNSYIYNNIGYMIAENCDTCNLDTATYYINKALSMSPENPYFLDSKGYVLFKTGKYDRALDYLKESLNLQPNGIVFYHIALVYIAKDDVETAKQYLKMALKYKNRTDSMVYSKIVKLVKKLNIR